MECGLCHTRIRPSTVITVCSQGLDVTELLLFPLEYERNCLQVVYSKIDSWRIPINITRTVQTNDLHIIWPFAKSWFRIVGKWRFTFDQMQHILNTCMYLNEIWINSTFNGKLLVNVWCPGIKRGKSWRL